MKHPMARALSAAGVIGAASLILTLPAQAESPDATPAPAVSSTTASPSNTPNIKISLAEGEAATMNTAIIVPSLHSTAADPEAPAVIVPGDSGRGTLTVTNSGPTDGTLKVYLLNPEHTSVKADDSWADDMTWTVNAIPGSMTEWEAKAQPLAPVPGEKTPATGALATEIPLAKGASTTIDLAYDFPFEATSANAGGQHSYEAGPRTARTDIRVVIEGEDTTPTPTPPATVTPSATPVPSPAPSVTPPAPSPEQTPPSGAVTGDPVRNTSTTSIIIRGVLGVIALATIAFIGHAVLRKTLLKEN